MVEIINTKLILSSEELEEIINEYFLKKGIELETIQFYGTNLDYVNRKDYMGVPKFNLKNVVCEYNNKNVKST